MKKSNDYNDGGKNKVVSIRLSDRHFEMLRDNGDNAKVSTKAQSIIQEHLESIYGTRHTWMTLPVSLGKYFFSLLNDEHISEYCDLLYKEVEKLNHSEFPDKSLWETWLALEKSWNQTIASRYSSKKIGNTYHIYIEHGLNIQSSKVCYEMYRRIAPLVGKLDKVQLDEDKVVMKLTMTNNPA